MSLPYTARRLALSDPFRALIINSKWIKRRIKPSHTLQFRAMESVSSTQLSPSSLQSKMLILLIPWSLVKTSKSTWYCVLKYLKKPQVVGKDHLCVLGTSRVPVRKAGVRSLIRIKTFWGLKKLNQTTKQNPPKTPKPPNWRPH